MNSDGKAYFSCTVRGCRAVVKADYRSKEAMNKEEPVVYRPSIPTSSCHRLEDGRVHPVQVKSIVIIVVVVLVVVVIVVIS